MEIFTTLMEESKGSIANRELHSFGSFEEFGSRMYKGIRLPNGSIMSIQASSMHHCQPELSVPLSDYTSMEVLFYSPDGSVIFIDDVTTNEVVANGFKDCWSGTDYGYVSVILIQLLCIDVGLV